MTGATYAHPKKILALWAISLLAGAKPPGICPASLFPIIHLKNLNGRLMLARSRSNLPNAPLVSAFSALRFRPDAVVGMPVALAIFRFAWVMPRMLLTEGLLLGVSFTGTS